jgi:hypothetical protein
MTQLQKAILTGIIDELPTNIGDYKLEHKLQEHPTRLGPHSIHILTYYQHPELTYLESGCTIVYPLVHIILNDTTITIDPFSQSTHNLIEHIDIANPELIQTIIKTITNITTQLDTNRLKHTDTQNPKANTHTQTITSQTPGTHP